MLHNQEESKFNWKVLESTSYPDFSLFVSFSVLIHTTLVTVLIHNIFQLRRNF